MCFGPNTNLNNNKGGGGKGCNVISHVTQTTEYYYSIILDMFGIMAESISPSEGIMFN